MRSIAYNLKQKDSAGTKYQKEVVTNNYSTFINKFKTYTTSAQDLFNEKSFNQEPVALLIYKLLQNTFILTIQKPNEVVQGSMVVNESKELNLSFENNSYPITYNDQVITIQDLTKPLLTVINGKINSNLPDLFMNSFDNKVLSFCIGRLFSRYQVVSKRGFLKEIRKVKWADSDDLRWAVKEIEKTLGIVEKDFLLNNGKKVKGVAPYKKLIHSSFSGHEEARQPWQETFPEEDIFIQGGSMGIVFSPKGNYTTAFVEVFPKYLKDKDNFFSSFIRGEGNTLQEAEKEAFELTKQAKNCLEHLWEPKGRNDGCGFCKKCKVFNSNAFPELKVK